MSAVSFLLSCGNLRRCQVPRVGVSYSPDELFLVSCCFLVAFLTSAKQAGIPRLVHGGTGLKAQISILNFSCLKHMLFVSRLKRV